MAYLKVNDVDISHLTNSLKVGYETLVSDKSGRNAAGDTFVDIINHKVKLYVGIRHTTQEEMQSFLNIIKDYVVNVTFLNPKTNSLTTIKAYTGTPEPDYYTIQGSNIIYKPLSLNFIEL